MTVQDSALRMALRAMLNDPSCPECDKSRLWVETCLAEVGWTDHRRESLKPLALRWAHRQPGGMALALRKACGEELTTEEEEVLSNPARLPSTRSTTDARQKGHTAMTTLAEPRPKVTQDTSMDQVYGLDAEALRELNVQREIMNKAPYNTPVEKFAQAFKAVKQGDVRVGTGTESVTHPHWTVVGRLDKKTNLRPTYIVSKDMLCNCPHGTTHPREKYGCYHAVAAELFQRWQRALHPELPLPLPPATPEERLAAGPSLPAQETIAAQDDLGHSPQPAHATSDPDAKNEVSMSTPAEHEFIPEPELETRPELGPVPAARPLRKLWLPLRSINAIVADLSRPLPQACVASKTQGGQPIPFLHWQTVARVLDAYAPGWHGHVSRVDTVGKACAITYRITIPCLEGGVSREATGQEDEELPEKAYGDSTSNGEAMAFKRAAAKFGVGLWLYDKGNDPTAKALADHFRNEKMTALSELGKALDDAGLNREQTIAWLRTQTGASKNAEIPLAAIRALTAHVAEAKS